MAEVMSIAPDLLAVTACVFLLALLRENLIVSAEKTRLFAAVTMLMIGVIAIEIATVYVDAYGRSSLDVLDEVLYSCIYLAAPVVLLLLATLYDSTMLRYRRFALAGIVAYAVFILSNLLIHQLFAVTGDTSYARGPLYPVYLVVTIAAGATFLVANNHAIRGRSGYRRWILWGIFAFVVVFSLLEALFPNVLVIWPAFSLGMVLYYVYLRELEFAYDALTGVLNRKAFSEAMTSVGSRLDIGLAMFDLNGLKGVNDSMGHGRGDDYLVAAARILEETFDGRGTVYRIGGDEFCAICEGATAESMQTALDALSERVTAYGRDVDYDFSIAWGFSMRGNPTESLFLTLARADRLMYDRKRQTSAYFREAPDIEEDVAWDERY